MDIELDFLSPIHQIKNKIFDEAEINVFVKRDDLIHPLISGNKWRKLKYILKKAVAENKTHLVTFGGAYSNHLLATSAAAAQFGLKSTGIVRGEMVNNDILFLCKLHGMELQFVDRASYQDKPALFNKYFLNDPDAFFINEGGASAEGAKGCSEIIGELPQIYDHVFCASGTGTTVAGIINGINELNLKTQINSVPILKNGSFLENEIELFLNKKHPFTLHTDYHFGGYAKTTPELISFIKQFIADTGMLIDPVYTGKLFYAIFDLATKKYFKPGSNVLAIHTGGLWGILGMQEKF